MISWAGDTISAFPEFDLDHVDEIGLGIDEGRRVINGRDALTNILNRQGRLSLEDERAISTIPMTVRIFASGDFIGREGKSPPTCTMLTRGFAVRQKTTAPGDKQIVSIHGPGDGLNLQNAFLKYCDYDIVSIKGCEVYSFDASAIRVLAAERPAVASALTTEAFAEASIAREWMLNIGRRNARTRLAHFLCEYLDRTSMRQHPSDGKYELKLTQEQIANATGMTAVHVNRKLKELQSDRLIVQLGRFINVPNMAELMLAGEYTENYRHLTKPIS